MREASKSEFTRVYLDSVGDVLRFLTPQMQQEIASHNSGWRAEYTDFAVYLRASDVRYYTAYRHLAVRGRERSVCDVGGFWGAFPIALMRLGYQVSMTECLRYYSNTFDELFDFIRSQGVGIVDYDPFATDAAPPGQYDYVTVMAVLEHYPHSLKSFMRNVIAMMRPGGEVYFEAPNIAFWPKRVGLLRGSTPLTPLREIFHSEVPFIGHHHEFTMRELHELIELAGLSVTAQEQFNYTPGFEPSLSGFVRHPIRSTAFALLPDSREILGVLCRRKDATTR